MEYRVKDIKLADIGKKRIDWAESHMPVLNALRNKYENSKPLKGIRVAGCLHVTKETGVLVRTLKAAGAEISWCGCNPLSTQDDVAASLARYEEIGIFASRGVTTEEYYADIHSTMDLRPNITIDDGADLTVEIHNSLSSSSSSSSSNNYNLFGGTEETTTGVIRLRAMEKSGKLMYPIVAVNDAETKHDFDNVYGTGQSALDGAILANAGHFNVEIAVAELEKNAIKKDQITDNTMKYELSQNKKVYLIGEGRLVNLAAAEGHPSEVMDMSFANQFLSVIRLSTDGKGLKPIVYDIDKSQDQEIALAKLQSMNVKIDVLSPEQKEYLEGFSEGT